MALSPGQLDAGHLDPDDLLEAALADQAGQQLAAAAAQIQHPLRTRRHDQLADPLEPLIVQPQRLFERRLRVDARGRVQDDRAFGLVGRHQPGQGGADQRLAPAQIARDDQVALRVPLQPAFAPLQQLGHLGLVDEVVLALVEDRHEHVEMGEQLAQATGGGQPQGDIGGHAPVRLGRVERMRGDLDRIAQGLEQVRHQLRRAAHGQGCDHRLQRDRAVGQCLAVPAAARHRLAHRTGQRHAQEGRGGVGPIADIVGLEAGLARLAADQGHRIHLQDQRELAARVAGLGIDHDRAPEAQGDLVRPLRVLVQEIAEIGGWPRSGRDGKEHGRDQSGMNARFIIEARIATCARARHLRTQRRGMGGEPVAPG